LPKVLALFAKGASHQNNHNQRPAPPRRQRRKTVSEGRLVSKLSTLAPTHRSRNARAKDDAIADVLLRPSRGQCSCGEAAGIAGCGRALPRPRVSRFASTAAICAAEVMVELANRTAKIII
jgi:hypothetical protein